MVCLRGEVCKLSFIFLLFSFVFLLNPHSFLGTVTGEHSHLASDYLVHRKHLCEPSFLRSVLELSSASSIDSDSDVDDIRDNVSQSLVPAAGDDPFFYVSFLIII